MRFSRSGDDGPPLDREDPPYREDPPPRPGPNDRRTIPRRPRYPSGDPRWWIETTDDGSRTLVTRRPADDRPDEEAFADPHAVTYHSGCGAHSECEHVYLKYGGIQGPANHWPARILEVGLGTGMALLCTLDRYLETSAPLQYLGLETIPLPLSVLQQVFPPKDSGRWRHPDLPDRFLRWYESQSFGGQTNHVWQVDALRSIEIRVEPLNKWFRNNTSTFDAIYFDPFDPAAAPELWQPDVMEALRRHILPGGRLVTYCVKGQVRRRMQAAGWTAERVPGPPGGKREVLMATADPPSVHS